MALINPPPTDSVDHGVTDFTGLVRVRDGWRNFFNATFTVCSALTMSGTTANRPTVLLWAGRPYFDISLAANGKPIWRNKGNTGWVDATGAAV